MYAVDYHTHSRCSPDSSARLTDMLRSAQRMGLMELCTTDHCDLQQEDGSALERWDWSPILRQYDSTLQRVKPGGTRLLLGIELGGAHTDPARAADLLSGAPLDFVIGSVHNLSPAAGGRDFFYLDLSSPEVCRQVMDDYFSSLLALAPLQTYDSLGHIIYPLRYINGRAGHSFTLAPWQDKLDALLRTVIETGRAIELNTHGGREVEDWREVLLRYRALGGELVTIGSDAHNPMLVGKGIGQATLLLQETGFRWLTLFRQRVPHPIKL